MAVRVGLITGLAAALLAGCADAPAPRAGAPVVVRAATSRGVPEATGRPLLTLTGVGTGQRSVDRGGLDRLAQVRLRVWEPWLKQEQTFRGVWLADLLAAVGATGWRSLLVTGLDDYAITLTAADLRGGGVLLATADGDGRALAVADGGPTRIVFQSGTPAGRGDEQWIWSLRSIDVR